MKTFVLALVLASLSFTPALAQDASPVAVIEGAVGLLAEKMAGRQDELASDRDSLYSLIDEILLPRFDRKFAAQMVLAKHWRVADEAQRERFIEVRVVQQTSVGMAASCISTKNELEWAEAIPCHHPRVRCACRAFEGSEAHGDPCLGEYAPRHGDLGGIEIRTRYRDENRVGHHSMLQAHPPAIGANRRLVKKVPGARE